MHICMYVYMCMMVSHHKHVHMINLSLYMYMCMYIHEWGYVFVHIYIHRLRITTHTASCMYVALCATQDPGLCRRADYMQDSHMC